MQLFNCLFFRVLVRNFIQLHPKNVRARIILREIQNVEVEDLGIQTLLKETPLDGFESFCFNGSKSLHKYVFYIDYMKTVN